MTNEGNMVKYLPIEETKNELEYWFNVDQHGEVDNGWVLLERLIERHQKRVEYAAAQAIRHLRDSRPVGHTRKASYILALTQAADLIDPDVYTP